MFEFMCNIQQTIQLFAARRGGGEVLTEDEMLAYNSMLNLTRRFCEQEAKQFEDPERNTARSP